MKSESKILALDLCPQANLSELFLGSLIYNGSENLTKLQNKQTRATIGGYFQIRLPSPYSTPSFDPNDFICTPSHIRSLFLSSHHCIPSNIDLVPGDSLVELQANAVSTLANTMIPGTNTWFKVINWLNDFISKTNNKYDYLFIDTNPSFSIYTQIALAAADKVVLPIMADDSSKRAIQNALALVHGIALPTFYADYNFSTQLQKAGKNPPKFHLFVKNRLTQYMGPASAYHSVLTSINKIISKHLESNSNIFSFQNLDDGIVEIRDFQSTGVVSFAYGCPFVKMRTGNYEMPGREKPTQISKEYLDNCNEAVGELVNLL